MKTTLPLLRSLKAKAPLLLWALWLNGSALAGTLREQMQAELDSSPALAAQQVKMRVAEERQGSVTLEMTQGPKQLRDLFRRGYEINGSAFADWNLEPAALKALRSIRKTVHTLKVLPGVKEISLTGALDAAGEKNRDDPPLKPDSAPPTNPSTAGALREQIQAELDSSPELAAQGMKLRVTYECRGNLILEITEGPKKIRDLFRRGYEINGSALGEANLALEEVKALRSIRRILKSLKEIPGVGEISLTGAPEASENPARQPADSASPPGKPAWENPLMQKIQMKLDASPFLEEQKIKMRVLDEMDGRVSLELSSGPKQLRDLFRKGYELNGNGLGEANLKPDSVKALRSIKRTLKPIKGFAGVKEIALTGAVDFLMDPAQDLYEQAGEKINHSDSRVRCEAIPLLIKSAELGFAPAQADLAKAYSLGIDVRQDDKKAFYWLEKAAQQGDPTTQFNLGGLCVQGRGTSRNYKQGIAWYRTAAEQDCDTEVRTRSQVALASLLATRPDPTLRDGEAALAYAQKGYAAAPDGIAIEVLAFAYARCGRFEEALEQEKRWLQKLEKAKYLPPKQKESLIEKAQYRIELFKGRQAYTLPE